MLYTQRRLGFQSFWSRKAFFRAQNDPQTRIETFDLEELLRQWALARHASSPCRPRADLARVQWVQDPLSHISHAISVKLWIGRFAHWSGSFLRACFASVFVCLCETFCRDHDEIIEIQDRHDLAHFFWLRWLPRNFCIPSGKRLHNYGKIHHFQ